MTDEQPWIELAEPPLPDRGGRRVKAAIAGAVVLILLVALLVRTTRGSGPADRLASATEGVTETPIGGEATSTTERDIEGVTGAEDPTSTTATSTAASRGDATAVVATAPTPYSDPDRPWIDKAMWPVFISYSVDPESTPPDSTVRLSWRILDREGITSTTFSVLDGNGTPVAWGSECAPRRPGTRSQGDQYDGWYTGTCFVPSDAPTGDYRLAVYAVDAIGQVRSDENFAPVRVESIATTTFVSGSVSPTSAARGETVEVVWRLQSTTGVTNSTFFIIRDEAGPSSSDCPAGSGVQPAEGDARDGTYRATCVLPTDMAPGRYEVKVDSEDQQGVSVHVIGYLDVT